MAKKRYRMTPRRRAAIKKAQAASARKRRLSGVKNGLKITGYIIGASTAAAATYGTNVYLRDAAKDMARGVRPRAPWSPPRAKHAPKTTLSLTEKAAPMPLKSIKGMSWIK